MSAIPFAVAPATRCFSQLLLTLAYPSMSMFFQRNLYSFYARVTGPLPPRLGAAPASGNLLLRIDDAVIQAHSLSRRVDTQVVREEFPAREVRFKRGRTLQRGNLRAHDGGVRVFARFVAGKRRAGKPQPLAHLAGFHQLARCRDERIDQARAAIAAQIVKQLAALVTRQKIAGERILYLREQMSPPTAARAIEQQRPADAVQFGNIA